MRRRGVRWVIVVVTAAVVAMPVSASASSTCNDGEVNPGDINRTLRDLGKATGLEHLGNELNSTFGSLRKVDGLVPLGDVCEQLPD